MGHYDDYYEARYERERKEREQYLLSEIKAGELDCLVKAARTIKSETVTIDLYRFEKMLNILKRIDGRVV